MNISEVREDLLRVQTHRRKEAADTTRSHAVREFAAGVGEGIEIALDRLNKLAAASVKEAERHLPQGMGL